MITTAEISPSPILAPFVRCYTFRAFDTESQNLTSPWHASQEITMPFFFRAKPVHLINPQTGQFIKGGSYGCITGLGTQCNGEITFNGQYNIFQIIFRPTGFYQIFRLPSSEITNFVFNTEDILGNKIKDLYERLCFANNLTEMGALVDAQLIKYLKKQKAVIGNDGITAISNLIIRNSGLINIEHLAYEANMSKRNFERHFTEEVGIPPKLFCCVTRFNNAFALKLSNPEINWTSIASNCGYFDQMHLIKDFKRFAGNNPSLFLKKTVLTEEIYTSRVGI